MESFAGRVASVVLVLVLVPALGVANPGYGGREKKACIYCHVQVGGGGGLNGNGSLYLKNGHTFPKPDEEDEQSSSSESSPSTTGTTEVVEGGGEGGQGEDSGSSETEEPATEEPESPAQKLARERTLRQIESRIRFDRARQGEAAWAHVVDQGKNVFHTTVSKLTSTGKTCVDCHKADELAARAGDYPRWDPRLGAVVSLDRKIRSCIFSRQNGEALPADAAAVVALTAYLREVAAGRQK